MRQKRALDDVWLTDGEGMMTTCARYHAHLAVVIDTKDVSAQSEFILSEIHICAQHDLEESHFQVISEAHLASQLKDVNGIVVHACARHGAYCPVWLTFLRVRHKPVWTTHFVKLVR